MNAEHFTQIDLDRSRFVRFWKRTQPLCLCANRQYWKWL